MEKGKSLLLNWTLIFTFVFICFFSYLDLMKWIYLQHTHLAVAFARWKFLFLSLIIIKDSSGQMRWLNAYPLKENSKAPCKRTQQLPLLLDVRGRRHIFPRLTSTGRLVYSPRPAPPPHPYLTSPWYSAAQITLHSRRNADMHLREGVNCIKRGRNVLLRNTCSIACAKYA